jgi:hypothetical protein
MNGRIEIGDKFEYTNSIFGDLFGKVGTVTSVFTFKRPNHIRSHVLTIDFGGSVKEYNYPNKDLRRII